MKLREKDYENYGAGTTLIWNKGHDGVYVKLSRVGYFKDLRTGKDIQGWVENRSLKGVTCCISFIPEEFLE